MSTAEGPDVDILQRRVTGGLRAQEGKTLLDVSMGGGVKENLVRTGRGEDD